MDVFVRNAWLVPTLPLIGALVAAIGGRQLRQMAHVPVVAGIGLAFLVSLALLRGAGSPATPTQFEWIEISGLSVPIQLQADGLTTMMLSMVTFVATLVAIFASGYMAGDPAYPRFFALVGLFVFSMTGLLLSANYLLTYAFWEGVGVCSYLLVGFWHSKPAAAAAAKKAFLVNRVGDVGFAIAIFWMWAASKNHDLSYANVLSHENLEMLAASGAIAGIAGLLFWAATAKSAQVPLYVWLPDAMEGPTPVSALIHAATMVTAGVYLIARSTPMLVEVPGVQVLVCATGCVTALLAAAIALTQTDLKRVMAYSTVSQLGYMFMGLGAGVEGVTEFAVIGAMFHLFTHAFFKALLFLASGSVMHSMGGVIDMREFGGLRRKLPITFLTFTAGALALCGIPPFAGFFSKDEILTALKLAAHHGASAAGEHGHAAAGHSYGWAYSVIYWTAVVTAGMTAFYTGRAYFLTFFGPERLPSEEAIAAAGHGASSAEPEAAHHTGADSHGHAADHGHGHAHDDHGHGHHAIGEESPPVMTIPLIILAVCATLVGLVFGAQTFGWFEHHLELTPGLHPVEGEAKHGFDFAVATVGTLVGLGGIALAYLFYGTRSAVPGRLANSLRPLYLASLHKFFIDEIYARVVVLPTRILALTAEFLDKTLVDGLVQSMAWIPRIVGRHVLAPVQNGLIQWYAVVTALSVSLLLLAALFLIY